ncbi:zinc-dependent alcohol dehydrogenase [Psychrobacillus soli]|uniref:Zinc-binding dehydrogenase n=1 Tax=Psychrobacillus soli TaxID=1543965 RepID=A0A544TL98_9BACI|nr:alcohol dehydrogenase catalytic domain-containing protein [Psychrobacillus soli]TQR18237.1 zinc-binding dehydrogenase [Psychrobacillus soli]
MRKTQLKAENTIEIVHQDIPEIGENEVLIRSIACGICGSDLHAYNFSAGYEFVAKNVTLGHEVSGEIVKIGAKVPNELMYRQVVAQSMNYCSKCEACENGHFSLCTNNRVLGLHFDGGLAEYFKIDAKYVELLPEGIDVEIALLAEPLTIAVHAINRLQIDLKGKTVLVQGPGIIGFFVSILCVSKGANTYLSGLPHDYEKRLSKAESWGVKSHVVGETDMEEKVDVIFECSGSSNALLMNTKVLKKNGKIMLVALYEHPTEVFFTPVVRNEWSIIPSYGSDPNEYKEALQFIQKHQEELKALPTYYDLENITQAFTDSLNKQVMKAIIKIGSVEENNNEYFNTTISAN